jgi:two-component system chemotaxis sensor kinase CheA
MIRNSADHGLEGPDERIAAGKPAKGTIILRAYHEGGQIIIEIQDDGRGINPEKIKKKIIEKNLASEEELASMNDWQIINFVFKPGFSTAEAITSVSGRGVGMDVVKSNIEKLGGIVDLNSVVGKGTRFTIKIPLTLTIISALIFESAGERFAIPQLSVTELVRVSRRSQHKIEYINKTAVLRLRNGLLPLIFLSDFFGLSEPIADYSTQDLCVIVVNVGAVGFGIVVDRVFDIQEIVVKPLSKVLRDIRFFSGSTILGDGGIVMILDPNSIANQLKDASGGDSSLVVESGSQRLGPEQTLLLVFNVSELSYAVPLALVARISEISFKDLEYVNGTWLARYHDHLLPLSKFEGNWSMDDIQENSTKTFPVLIFTDRGHAVGIAIDEIANILETVLDIEIHNRNDGILGTSIIDGVTTSIIDCEYHLKRAYPSWFEHKSLVQQHGVRKMKVLVVDDSQFFRSLIVPVLTLADFEVVQGTDAQHGLRLARQHSDAEIIISDIEMPGMSGFEFVKELRQLKGFNEKIIIALTSRGSEEDIKRGREAGFDYHFEKTKQKELLACVEKVREGILKSEYEI